MESLIYQLICFLADSLNILPQALATYLPYVTFRFTWQTLQTLVTIAFFLDRLLAFPNVRRSSNFKICSLGQKNQQQEIRKRIGAYRFCHQRSGVILIG